MPYGYEKHRLSMRISPLTVGTESSMIASMLTFINKKYGKDIEPYKIRPVDITDYLDSQRLLGLEDSTINKKLVYIRNWFDYMWNIGEIKIDFMPKLKYQDKLDLTPSIINIDYVALLNKKSMLLKDKKLTLTSKLLFVFYMRGLRVRDILNIKVDDFTDNLDSLSFQMILKSGMIATIHFEDEEEIGILLEGIERSVFRNVSYLFSSKVKNEYTAFRLTSLGNYVESLTIYFGKPFKSGEIRYAYVHYLYKVQQKNIEEIQKELGLSLATTSRILKDSLERIPTVDYNVKRTTVQLDN